MYRIYTLLLGLLIYSTITQGQTITSERNSTNREILSHYDCKVEEIDGIYMLKFNDEASERNLTGLFVYQNSNNRTIDLELENNIAKGNWKYYDHTFQGSIIGSTVNFVNGYKNEVETIYSYEWNKESELFDSYIRATTDYDMGKEKQKIKYWQDGQIEFKYTYDKNGRLHGSFTHYNKDRSIYCITKYKHGKKDGLWEFFFSANKLQETILHKNNLVKTQTYHTNGKPAISKTTNNRVFEGKYLQLSETGDTIRHHYYKKGIEQGCQFEIQSAGFWKPSFNIKYFVNKKGLLQGDYTQLFADSKKPRVKGKYNKNGQRDALWQYYLEDGRIYRTETFSNGIQTTYPTLHTETSEEYHLEKFTSEPIPKRVEQDALFLFGE